MRWDQNRRYIVPLIGAMLVRLAMGWQPMKLAVIADFRSGRHTEEVTVASGDVIVLDAASALSDETAAETRDVTLLAGAGFFDVNTSERGFVVRVGDATVETIGTAFKVSLQGATPNVSVAEAAVLVRHAAEPLMSGPESACAGPAA